MAQTNRAMNSNGRKVIYTDAVEITASNIADVLKSAMDIHESNRSDIQYLYDVYRGKHDILGRTKEIRPEILNNIVINYPYRIVRFKTGYNLGEPIQYIGRDVEEGDEVGQLNIYMEDLGKETADILLSDWCYIAGVGYRYANVDTTAPEDMPPFKMTVLDPRYTFVAYDMSIEHRQKFCCTFTENEDGDRWSYVYTDTQFFTIDPDGNVSEETYIGAEQPIVEYRYNEARLGIFEVVMSIVNAIDTVTSNRIDGIEQFVQALLLFKGVNIDAEAYQQLKEEGAILVPEGGDVQYIVSELNQEQTQTLIDCMYQQMLEIVGMPNRSGATRSTSDTGVAVIYRDGWSDAEAYAKSDEKMFKQSEKKFLRLVCDFCNTRRGLGLKASDIQINFTRRNYENIASKSEVLLGMLGSSKVHPKLAFTYSGMFPDPEQAYAMSKEYAEEQEQLSLERLEAETEPSEDLNNGNGTAEEETE